MSDAEIFPLESDLPRFGRTAVMPVREQPSVITFGLERIGGTRIPDI